MSLLLSRRKTQGQLHLLRGPFRYLSPNNEPSLPRRGTQIHSYLFSGSLKLCFSFPTLPTSFSLPSPSPSPPPSLRTLPPFPCPPTPFVAPYFPFPSSLLPFPSSLLTPLPPFPPLP